MRSICLHTRRRKSVLLIPLAFVLLAFLLPFYVMLIGTFKPSLALQKIPADLNPFTHMSFGNIVSVSRRIDILAAFRNSLFISVSICAITIVIGATGGYAFSKRSFAGKKAWFVLLLLTMMLPRQILMVPNYIVARGFGINGLPIGVVLTSINSAYGIFLCRQFISSIPDDLLCAAKLDGCNEMGVFTHTILPLSTPVLSSLVIFTFFSSWNDFVWQNVMLTKKVYRTIPLALSFLSNLSSNVLQDLGNQMAGATISAVPMIALFLCFQKYFVEGITGGAIKE